MARARSEGSEVIYAITSYEKETLVQAGAEQSDPGFLEYRRRPTIYGLWFPSGRGDFMICTMMASDRYLSE